MTRMARRRRPSIDELMPNPTPRLKLAGALTAAAQRITGRRIGNRDVVSTGKGWQREAWRLHKAVPEQRFIVNTLARRIGQARLFVGTIPDDGTSAPDPVDEDNGGAKFAEEIATVLHSIGQSMGMSQILARMYTNLNVAGECWLVGIPHNLIDPDDGRTALDDLDPTGLHWQVLSTSEIVPDMRGTLTLKTGATAGDIECVPDDVYLIRVWSPDPEMAAEADSPTRSLLPVLRELVGLTMHVSAQIDSRLAGAGILAVPQSASRAMRAAAGLPESSDEDPLTDALIESMMTPINDRDSAAALVPLVLSIPDESVDKLKHISFAAPLDEHAQDLREESIRRIALGQDAPPELLLGTGTLNHWCRPVGTLAYTRDGWAVPGIGDDILTTDGWSPVTALYQADATGDAGINVTVCAAHGGPHSYTITATDGHRFYIERDGARILTDDPRTGDTILRGIEQTAHLPQQPIHEDAMVELLAWYSSDGTMTGTSEQPRQVRIAKKDNWPRFERVLTDLWGPAQESMPTGADKPMWRQETRSNGVHLAVLNANARDQVLNLVPGKSKVIPHSFVRQLTAKQLDLFLDAWADGDGERSGKGLTIVQRREERLNAPEYAAVLSGKAVRRSVYVNYGFTSGVMHRLRISDETEVHVLDVQPMQLEGEVWCPTTDSGTWLAHDPVSGWSDYTGNSSWAMQEDVVKSHLEPPLQEICDALTTQLLRPVLIDAFGMSEEAAARYVVWYDVDHLISRPTRGADAVTLNNAGLLSGEATRAAMGFDENDAPSAVDPAVTTALSMLTQAPSLLGTLSIGELVEAIRAVMDGSSDPVPIDDVVVDDAPVSPGPPAGGPDG